MRPLIFAVLTLLVTASSAAAQWASSAGALRITEVMRGLDEPWAVGFLPGGEILVTERGGGLVLRRADGSVGRVAHDLDIAVDGQGGLLDVLIPRDFAQTREVLLSYAKRQGRRGSGTALAVGRLSADGTRLEATRLLFEMEPGTRGGRHFGSRIVEGRDGMIYLTIGDRGDRPSAQDLSIESGSVIRIARDGAVPETNPFVGRGQPEIWSYGHRNPQGAALGLDGQLWVVEHGARGGDEVNLVKRGGNYGWPVISYGTHYSGAKIGEGTARAGMEQPAHYWDPSIAPSGMMIYSGKLWPQWRGDIFVGSLKFDYISRLSGATLNEVEALKGRESERVRDIREAPDGSIWFLSVGSGALYQLTPAR